MASFNVERWTLNVGRLPSAVISPTLSKPPLPPDFPPADPLQPAAFPRSRPSVLFEHPEPATALALQPDHPPSQLHWRGRQHTLIAGQGPERIAAEWWRDLQSKSPAPRARRNNDANEQPVSFRDYYKVQTADGCWLWLFRQCHSTHWFVHGIWT